MNGQFNAIDYAQQLEAAGVPQAQAEVHAKMLALALVSCAASRADLAALGEKLNCRIDAMHQELTAHIDSVEQKLTYRIDNGIDALRQEIINAKKSFFWLFATNASLSIAILVKLYSP
jgi:hypothetical protein